MICLKKTKIVAQDQKLGAMGSTNPNPNPSPIRSLHIVT